MESKPWISDRKWVPVELRQVETLLVELEASTLKWPLTSQAWRFVQFPNYLYDQVLNKYCVHTTSVKIH